MHTYIHTHTHIYIYTGGEHASPNSFPIQRLGSRFFSPFPSFSSRINDLARIPREGEGSGSLHARHAISPLIRARTILRPFFVNEDGVYRRAEGESWMGEGVFLHFEGKRESGECGGCFFFTLPSFISYEVGGKRMSVCCRAISVWRL